MTTSSATTAPVWNAVVAASAAQTVLLSNRVSYRRLLNLYYSRIAAGSSVTNGTHVSPVYTLLVPCFLQKIQQHSSRTVHRFRTSSGTLCVFGRTDSVRVAAEYNTRLINANTLLDSLTTRRGHRFMDVQVYDSRKDRHKLSAVSPSLSCLRTDACHDLAMMTFTRLDYCNALLAFLLTCSSLACVFARG